MKNLTIAGTLVVAFGLAAPQSAQALNTASGSATVEIAGGISITNTAALRFGQIIPDVGSVVGTVTIGTDGTRSASIVTLAGGTSGAASFGVTGGAASTYAITLPTSITVTAAAGAPMTVDTFTSSPNGTGVLTGGSQTLLVGATLHVGAAQVPNSYSGTFNVTVAYN